MHRPNGEAVQELFFSQLSYLCLETRNIFRVLAMPIEYFEASITGSIVSLKELMELPKPLIME